LWCLLSQYIPVYFMYRAEFQLANASSKNIDYIGETGLYSQMNDSLLKKFMWYTSLFFCNMSNIHLCFFDMSNLRLYFCNLSDIRLDCFFICPIYVFNFVICPIYVLIVFVICLVGWSIYILFQPRGAVGKVGQNYLIPSGSLGSDFFVFSKN